MFDDKRIAEMRKVIAEATPLEEWDATSNYPFYVQIKKPAPSLSKHEGTLYGDCLWRYQDGLYLILAVHALPKALDEIERLQKIIEERSNAWLNEIEKNNSESN